MRKILFSQESVEDLHEIKVYLIRRRGSRVARHVLKAIHEGIQKVQQAPGIGHGRPDLTDEPVKFWSVFSYLIVYKTGLGSLEVVRVLHGHRNVATILAKDD